MERGTYLRGVRRGGGGGGIAWRFSRTQSGRNMRIPSQNARRSGGYKKQMHRDDWPHNVGNRLEKLSHIAARES